MSMYKKGLLFEAAFPGDEFFAPIKARVVKAVARKTASGVQFVETRLPWSDWEEDEEDE